MLKLFVLKTSAVALRAALAYLWLIEGSEGAGNLLAALIWLAFLLICIVASVEGKPHLQPKIPLRSLRWSVDLCVVAALIWHGHFTVGVVYLLALFIAAMVGDKGQQTAKQGG